MPLYLYQNPKTKKIKEVFQSMEEPHVYCEEEIEWKRVFTVPQGIIPINFDPQNPKDFAHKTKHSKGTLGDLTDRAAELSEKRKKDSPDGRDKFKDGFFDKWSKKRKGKVHPEDDR